MFVFLFFF